MIGFWVEVFDFKVNLKKFVGGVVFEVFFDCGCGLVVRVFVWGGMLCVGGFVFVGFGFGEVCVVVGEYGE